MGPGVDAKFDAVLQSLGKFAQKHAKPVIDSVMRWRKTHIDSNAYETPRLQSGRPGTATGRIHDAYVTDRRSLASVYIMCRALIAAIQTLPKDALPDMVGNRLEELAFNQFKQPDVKALSQSANYRANSELFATLLGSLANVRLVSCAAVRFKS